MATEDLKDLPDFPPYLSLQRPEQFTALREGSFTPTREWPDPTPAMLETPEFNAIWECIKTWDINVPEVDGDGLYSEATGNHVRAILDALQASGCWVEHFKHDPSYWSKTV